MRSGLRLVSGSVRSLRSRWPRARRGEIFAQIDAGTPLTGEDGLLTGVLKAAPGAGSWVAELTSHLGYEKGAADAAAHPNSRNGTSRKTVST